MVDVPHEPVSRVGIKRLKARRYEHQCHRGIRGEKMPVHQRETRTGRNFGQQTAAQVQRVGGNHLRERSSLIRHDHLIVLRHGLVRTCNRFVELLVHGGIHKRGHMHHRKVESAEGDVHIQTVKRVGYIIILQQDRVHQFIHITRHHFRFSTCHLHENLVFHLQISKHQTAVVGCYGRQQL